MGRRGPKSVAAWSPEAIARGLVVSLMPEIERRMSAGGEYLPTMRAVYGEARDAMTAEHGADVAYRVRGIMEGMGAVAVLTNYGRAEFIRRGLIIAPPAPRIVPSGGWAKIWMAIAPR